MSDPSIDSQSRLEEDTFSLLSPLIAMSSKVNRTDLTLTMINHSCKIPAKPEVSFSKYREHLTDACTTTTLIYCKANFSFVSFLMTLLPNLTYVDDSTNLPVKLRNK